MALLEAGGREDEAVTGAIRMGFAAADMEGRESISIASSLDEPAEDLRSVAM